MQEIVCEVIANVAKYTSAERRCRCVPIIEEDCVGKLVEWGCEGQKEGWRHD